MSKGIISINAVNRDYTARYAVNDYIDDLTVREGILYVNSDNGLIIGYPLASVICFTVNKIDD